MADPEDSLSFEFGKMKATATGRFTIVAVLAFVFVFAAGLTYFAGERVFARFIPETTASIK